MSAPNHPVPSAGSVPPVGRRHQRGLSFQALVLGLALATPLALTGCGETGVDPTVRPAITPLGTSLAPTNPPTPVITPRQTPTPWPRDWDEAFCPAFIETVVTTELVVDIPRALEEEANEDALALARELRGTATAAVELIQSVPDWEQAQPVLGEMQRVVDFGERIGRQYVRYLDEGRRPGLNRARELTDELHPIVEGANAQLEELAEVGLECPPYPLNLEAP